MLCMCGAVNGCWSSAIRGKQMVRATFEVPSPCLALPRCVSLLAHSKYFLRRQTASDPDSQVYTVHQAVRPLVSSSQACAAVLHAIPAA